MNIKLLIFPMLLITLTACNINNIDKNRKLSENWISEYSSEAGNRGYSADSTMNKSAGTHWTDISVINDESGEFHPAIDIASGYSRFMNYRGYLALTKNFMSGSSEVRYRLFIKNHHIVDNLLYDWSYVITFIAPDDQPETKKPVGISISRGEMYIAFNNGDATRIFDTPVGWWPKDIPGLKVKDIEALHYESGRDQAEYVYALNKEGTSIYRYLLYKFNNIPDNNLESWVKVADLPSGLIGKTIDINHNMESFFSTHNIWITTESNDVYELIVNGPFRWWYNRSTLSTGAKDVSVSADNSEKHPYIATLDGNLKRWKDHYNHWMAPEYEAPGQVNSVAVNEFGFPIVVLDNGRIFIDFLE